MPTNLSGLDIAVVVVYFLSVIFTGFWAMCRSNRNTVKGYFLAGQSMIWLPVGASLFASNIGSEHFIGLAGSGAAKGIGVGAFELNASILLQLLGWVFLPVYIHSGANTLPAYMKKRFGGYRIQCYLATISIIMYIFTKISVNLYSASLFIYEAAQLNLWISVTILLAMTAIITVTGGLAAVLYTDTLQCILMVIGSVVLTIISFVKIGGVSSLFTKYGQAVASVPAENYSAVINNTNLLKCYLPTRNAFQMLRSIDDPDMPWFGFILGQTPASIWYWCTDQMMVQRVMAAENINHAKGGTLFAGILKLLPLFIMVMPGMISRILYPNEIACATVADCLRVCNQASGCTNLAYPKLVMTLLPTGLRGLMLSVMLAALVTDLTSIFNSASTLFTMDIYSLIKKSAKERELVIVGRLFVSVLIVLSLLWLPVIQNMQGGQLYIYIQSISSYLSPPIAAVYIVALLWKRGNEKGAITSLIYGLIIGSMKMITDFVWREQPCEVEDLRPWFVVHLHYMYFAMFSFFTCILVMVIVSWTTAPLPMEYTKSTTYLSYLRGRRQQYTSHIVSETANDKCNPNGYHNGHGCIALKEAGDGVDTHVMEVEKSPTDKDTQEGNLRCQCRHLLKKYWVIFLGTSSDEADLITNETKEINLEKWLYEPIKIKWILNIIMICLILLVVGVYLVFSLALSDIEVGPVPMEFAVNVTGK